MVEVRPRQQPARFRGKVSFSQEGSLPLLFWHGRSTRAPNHSIPLQSGEDVPQNHETPQQKEYHSKTTNLSLKQVFSFQECIQYMCVLVSMHKGSNEKIIMARLLRPYPPPPFKPSDRLDFFYKYRDLKYSGNGFWHIFDYHCKKITSKKFFFTFLFFYSLIFKKMQLK